MFRSETTWTWVRCSGFEVYMKRYLKQLLFFAFTAIALWTSAFARPVEVKADEIRQCKSLGQVTGSSGCGKNPSWEPIAKTYAAIRAEKLGATHLVLVSKHQIGSFNGEVVLEAFNCNGKGE